jgi:hypothetical protein
MISLDLNMLAHGVKNILEDLRNTSGFMSNFSESYEK